MIKSTRLRFIIAKTPSDLSTTIDSLPFKIELKGIVPNGDSFIAFFVIPEIEGIEFSNLDLRGVT